MRLTSVCVLDDEIRALEGVGRAAKGAGARCSEALLEITLAQFRDQGQLLMGAEVGLAH